MKTLVLINKSRTSVKVDSFFAVFFLGKKNETGRKRVGGWVWVGVGGCGWVWVGVGGCGWIRVCVCVCVCVCV